jgi:hypothetical protein
MNAGFPSSSSSLRIFASNQTINPAASCGLRFHAMAKMRTSFLLLLKGDDAHWPQDQPVPVTTSWKQTQTVRYQDLNLIQEANNQSQIEGRGAKQDELKEFGKQAMRQHGGRH